MKNDVEDIFAMRYKCKSKLLKDRNLVESSSNDVSVTSVLAADKEAKDTREYLLQLDEVRTAWSAGGNDPKIACIARRTVVNMYVFTVVVIVMARHIYGKMKKRIFMDDFGEIGVVKEA